MYSLLRRNIINKSIDKYEFNFGECMYYDAVRLDMCVRNEGVSKCTVDVIFYDPNNPDESPTASAKETTTTTTNSKLVRIFRL